MIPLEIQLETEPQLVDGPTRPSPSHSTTNPARCCLKKLRTCRAKSDAQQGVEVCLSLPRSWGVESNLSFGFFGVVEMGSAVVVEPGLAGLL